VNHVLGELSVRRQLAESLARGLNRVTPSLLLLGAADVTLATLNAPDRGKTLTRKIHGGIHPDEAGHDYYGTFHRGRSNKFVGRIVTDLGDERARLQAGDEKYHPFDQVDKNPGKRCPGAASRR